MADEQQQPEPLEGVNQKGGGGQENQVGDKTPHPGEAVVGDVVVADDSVGVFQEGTSGDLVEDKAPTSSPFLQTPEILELQKFLQDTPGFDLESSQTSPENILQLLERLGHLVEGLSELEALNQALEAQVAAHQTALNRLNQQQQDGLLTDAEFLAATLHEAEAHADALNNLTSSQSSEEENPDKPPPPQNPKDLAEAISADPRKKDKIIAWVVAAGMKTLGASAFALQEVLSHLDPPALLAAVLQGIISDFSTPWANYYTRGESGEKPTMVDASSTKKALEQDRLKIAIEMKKWHQQGDLDARDGTSTGKWQAPDDLDWSKATSSPPNPEEYLKLMDSLVEYMFEQGLGSSEKILRFGKVSVVLGQVIGGDKHVLDQDSNKKLFEEMNKIRTEDPQNGLANFLRINVNHQS